MEDPVNWRLLFGKASTTGAAYWDDYPRSACLLRSQTAESDVLLRAYAKLLTEAGHTAPLPPLGEVLPGRGPLGQPLLLWQDQPIANTGVSVSHDGGRRVCLALHAEGLTGLGIDLVHLPRLLHKSPDDLLRFARRFMNESELEEFLSRSCNETNTEKARRLALHFAAMEAASKALGTGLRLYFGMGGEGRPAPREIELKHGKDGLAAEFHGIALERFTLLEAKRSEVRWRVADDLLVCVATLHT